jgi:hypothetical protein
VGGRAPLLDQIDQKIEDFRLKRSQFGPAAQLAAVRVDSAFFKPVEQFSIKSIRQPRASSLMKK